MPPDERYVFDANAIVSALLLPGSVPRRAFDRALDQGRILLSAPIIRELEDVLRRPRLDRYVLEEERMRFLVALIRVAIVIRVSVTVTESRDPKDNMYLELALVGEAKCVVSGDRHLLALHPFRGIPILRPNDFLEQFG
jgi:uncharacterized protein